MLKMNDIKKIFSNQDYRINKLVLNNNVYIIDTDQGKYVVKKKNNDTTSLFKYLRSKSFNNYLNDLNDYDDRYIINSYIESQNIDKEEKAKDIIEIVSTLHSKTTFYKSFSLDEIKEIYEDFNNEIDNLNLYYENLRLVMEETIFLSPSNYLLLRNISLIYVSLNSSKHFIDKWYNLIKEKKNRRTVLIHGNLELNHLLEDENKYLISWDKSHNNSPIFDLLYFYRNHYHELSFYELFMLYETRYPLLEEEKYLLYAHMLLPNKIDFNQEEILNTKSIYYMINYLNSSNDIVSKYHSGNTNNKEN